MVEQVRVIVTETHGPGLTGPSAVALHELCS